MGLDSGRKQLQWAILLLAIVVVLPTVCLLWFMSQAVKNERLVVRQKLVDVYTERAKTFFEEAPDDYFEAEINKLNSQATAEALTMFDIFATRPDSRYQGMLIFDANDKLVYPIFETLTDERNRDLETAFQQELSGDVEGALREYERIAGYSDSVTFRYKAILARARCLWKLDRQQEAIKLSYNLSYPENPERRRPVSSAMVVQARVYLASLYAKTDEEKLFYHLRRILGNSHYNNEKEDPFLPACPAQMIVWHLGQLINLAEAQGLSQKLADEISLARSRIYSYENSIEAANIYPNARSLDGWPVQTIRRISPESELYGFKFKLGERNVLCLSGFERMLKIITDGVNDIEDDTVGVLVYDNFGGLVSGDKDAVGEVFLTLNPGRFLPEFKAAIYFKETGVFEDAARKQIAIYTWTGVLVVLLILITGAVAMRAIGKQAKLNRLKNDFIATVTHELKTPLASTRVLVDTLLDGRYEERKQAHEYLQLISKENERLSHLIDNFLTFSRMERNKRAFNMSQVSPVEIANTAADAVRTKFEKVDVKFKLDISKPLPMLHADKDAMVTVLINLLDNACKYSYDNKQIELKVFAEDGSVCFAVKDNGIGMSKRVTKRVFKRFYQADSSLSRRAEGAGLGLAIVRFIVNAHKGSVSVESRAGKGSTFIIRLPKGS
jgi:signal transduction histidine kinase